MSATGACSDWELVLHAFFDAELNAADSLACELRLGRCQRCSGEMKDLNSGVPPSGGMRPTLREVELANIGFRSGIRCRFWQKSARATDSL
jgi:hypothetical protein